jgi:hypothetical protein
MIAHGQQARCSIPRKRTRGAAGPPDTPETPENASESLPTPPPLPHDHTQRAPAVPPVDPEERYTVEEVLDYREVDGVPHYLVKWAEYSVDEATWEDESGIDVDVLARYHHWGECLEQHEKQSTTVEHHPLKAQVQPDWRKKRPLRIHSQPKPKYNKRLTLDSQEAESDRGWKPGPANHNNHLKFQEYTKAHPEYKPGPQTFTKPDCTEGEYCEQWLPYDVWKLEALESNRYANQKIDGKQKKDSTDLAYDLYGPFTPDSVKFFYCVQLAVHGLNHATYNVCEELWGDDPLTNMGGYISDRMTKNYYLAHSRYMHWADNETADPEDRARHTRQLRELLHKINQRMYNLGPDAAGDEATLDTESTKVFNRIRCRFKPCSNEAVLYETCCDSVTGYVWSYEESRTDMSGDSTMEAVVGRMVDSVNQEKIPRYLFFDSRYMMPNAVVDAAKQGIYITGTLTHNRIGNPRQELAAIAADLKWGEWAVLHKGECEIVIWSDRAIVTVMTTAFCSTVTLSCNHHLTMMSR